MPYIRIFVLLLLLTPNLQAQNTPFQLQLEPLQIPQLGGLQSFAFGTSNGKWLLIGGRLDGLHRRQPFATFDIAGHNNQIIVADPQNSQKWSAPLNSLPAALREQLSSTNMEFFQKGDYLYIIGGYGYSATLGDHTTYPYLTVVEVPGLMTAIINGQTIAPYFRSYTDARFAVTGGQLVTVHDIFYLVGGQKFEGRYNPMGPTHGPGFQQDYTNQVRRFIVQDDGANLQISFLTPYTDSIQLHRRDYNVLPQIWPDGREGATAFSGVFQPTVDLPFLNAVNIDSSGYALAPNFTQYYNHYHCADVALYSQSAQEMHNVFFGGIAQFYDSLGVLVQDNNVPFVNTIARVTRHPDGQMQEFKLPITMPALLGAGAEFIPSENLPRFANEVIKLDELPSDTVVLGYIYGGIASTQPNIFWINTGTESQASSTIFKVKLLKNTAVGTDLLNPQSSGSLKLQLYPNPSGGQVSLKFFLQHSGEVKLHISDFSGKLLHQELLKNLPAGEHILRRNLPAPQGQAFLVRLESATEQALVKGMALER